MIPTVTTKFTHAERAKRREAIGQAALSKSIPEVAHDFGVSEATVYESVRGLGVCCIRKQKHRPKTMRILADLLNTDATQATIAANHRVTRQWVQQVYASAIEAGIKVPIRASHVNRREES